MLYFSLPSFYILSLVSLQTTVKTVNNLATLENIYYVYNYIKTKAALPDTLNKMALRTAM